jgi:hypothetical protein
VHSATRLEISSDRAAPIHLEWPPERAIPRQPNEAVGRGRGASISSARGWPRCRGRRPPCYCSIAIHRLLRLRRSCLRHRPLPPSSSIIVAANHSTPPLPATAHRMFGPGRLAAVSRRLAFAASRTATTARPPPPLPTSPSRASGHWSSETPNHKLTCLDHQPRPPATLPAATPPRSGHPLP